MTKKVYKIRNKETGLFSKGGTSFSEKNDIWVKEGKTWSNLGHLKNHLNLFFTSSNFKNSRYPYNNAEIIEVEISYDDCLKFDVDDLVEEILEKKVNKKRDYDEKINKLREEREIELYERLNKKYGNKRIE